jgi:hypothetical protein
MASILSRRFRLPGLMWDLDNSLSEYSTHRLALTGALQQPIGRLD